MDLLSLPNELLQHIASFSTCSSVLNLLRVNRQLRNACNDRLVFQSIARRDLNYSPASIRTVRLPCSERESILASGSLDELARLAFAAEKGVEAALAKDNSWALKISERSGNLDLSNWMPQMLILMHSATLDMEPETFLELQGRSHPRNKNRLLEKDFPAVNFILSHLLLNKILNTLDPSSIKKTFDHFFSENHSAGPAITDERRRIDDDSIDTLRQRVPNYGELKTDFDINQATALLPALILELGTHHLFPLELDWLPSPGKIPFASLLDMPALFQDSTTPPFSQWHVKKMAKAEFLRGNWVGFYSEQRSGPETRLFDPPMQDINIVARTPPLGTKRAENVAVIIERETRGVDAHGEFSLQGYVGESGLVSITKQYIVARWSWSWLGRLTPFGIVGVWGGGYDDFGGYFWIWKREWCNMTSKY